MIPEERTQLLAVYAVERQDDSSSLTVAFAITTTGLTYVIAALAYFKDHCDGSGCRDGIPVWLPILAPSIAVAFVGFLTLNVAASRMRSIHIQRLEHAIRVPVPTGTTEPSFHTDATLIFRPDRPLQRPTIVRAVFAAITFVSYGIVMATLLGFSWVILAYASGSWTLPKDLAALGYALVELIEILGFVLPLRHKRFTYDRPVHGLPH